MLNIDEIFSKTCVVMGITYKSNFIYQIEPELAERAFNRLEKEEFGLLKEMADRGVEIILQRSNNDHHGYFTARIGNDGRQNPVLTLSVSFKGVIDKGTIAHEHAHYQQWLRGDLGFVREEGFIYWKGERFALVGKASHAYLNQPWEREAFQVNAEFLGRTTKLPTWAWKAWFRLNIGTLSKLNVLEDKWYFPTLVWFINCAIIYGVTFWMWDWVFTALVMIMAGRSGKLWVDQITRIKKRFFPGKVVRPRGATIRVS